MTSRLISAVVALLLGTSVAAEAALLTFKGEDVGLGEATRLASHPNADAARASFFSRLVGVGTENFESFANGTPGPLAISFGAAGTATLTGAGATIVSVPSGTNGFGRYPVSGNNYWEAGANFVVNFSAPVAAFGFYGVDIGDFAGSLTLTLTGGGAQVINVGNAVNSPGGGVIYFGFIETQTFTSIAFGNTAAGTDAFAFDDFSVGSLQQVVPEPASVALLSIGILVIGLTRRTTRSATA